METENLFANDGQFLYILLDSRYYKRILGRGWLELPATPESVVLGKMPEPQAVLFWETISDKRFRAD